MDVNKIINEKLKDHDLSSLTKEVKHKKHKDIHCITFHLF